MFGNVKGHTGVLIACLGDLCSKAYELCPFGLAQAGQNRILGAFHDGAHGLKRTLPFVCQHQQLGTAIIRIGMTLHKALRDQPIYNAANGRTITRDQPCQRCLIDLGMIRNHTERRKLGGRHIQTKRLHMIRKNRSCYLLKAPDQVTGHGVNIRHFEYDKHTYKIGKLSRLGKLKGRNKYESK
jgi:hypothetical protein